MVGMRPRRTIMAPSDTLAPRGNIPAIVTALISIREIHAQEFGTKTVLVFLDRGPARMERGAVMEMTSSAMQVIAGAACRLLRPIRDREGRIRYEEHPRILRKITNLEREMFLVRFDDGATTFVFPDEIVAC